MSFAGRGAELPLIRVSTGGKSCIFAVRVDGCTCASADAALASACSSASQMLMHNPFPCLTAEHRTAIPLFPIALGKVFLFLDCISLWQPLAERSSSSLASSPMPSLLQPRSLTLLRPGHYGA